MLKEVNRKIYHLTRNRLTKTIVISALIFYSVVFIFNNITFIQFADRILFILLAWSFRRALGDAPHRAAK
jgi:hypothetical protein